ncbi:MAG: histidine phosphatase family protein [Oscillospiraceae bacterium]|nr:histidine phosphatase family protein [Oscillospiraceae bacterium]
MELVIIRHGDPDYEHDSLTEKGFREATLLQPRMERMQADYYYVSPLGRAQATAKTALKTLGIQPITLDWMQEFRGRCIRPDVGTSTICWDWMPEDWMAEPRFYDKDRWEEPQIYVDSNVPSEYHYVCKGLDELLAKHGYERSGDFYHAVKPNHDRVVLFCHFGVESAMLSHLLNISPMPLWHGTVALPTAVTVLKTEERREGKASWRMLCFGDLAHLYAAGEEPSFSARFCECFTDDTRH